MKKYVQTFFIIFFFCLCLAILPGNVFAHDEPVLLNDGISDFFVNGIVGDPKPILNEKDIASNLVEVPDYPVAFGAKLPFSLKDNTIFAIKILTEDYESYESEPYNLSDLAFRITTPSGNIYTINAKSILIFSASEPGKYFLQLIGDGTGFYTVDAFRLRSPYISSITFIGPNFPFKGYEEGFNEYVSLGGTGIIYDNTPALKYIGIKQLSQPLIIDKNYSATKIDGLFDPYVSEGESITFLESKLPTDTLTEYRKYSLVLKIPGSSSTGGILVVSPTFTLLDKSEMNPILRQIGTHITIEQKENVPLFNQIQIIFLVFLGLLLLALLYLTAGKIIIHIFQDKHYLSNRIHYLEERKASIKKLTVIINLSVILPLTFFVIFLILLWKKISEWILSISLHHIIPDLSFFYENFSIGEFLGVFVFPILVIVMIDMVVMAWLQWNFIIETRDFLSKLLFGWMSNVIKKLTVKILWYAVVLSSLSYVYINAFQSSDQLLVTFSLVVTFFAGLFYLSVMQREIVFSPLEKKVNLLLKILLIVAPVIYFFSTLYTLFSPFGFNQTYYFNEDAFNQIGSVDPKFSVIDQDLDFLFSYNPYTQKNDVKTKISQTLSSSDPIYLTVQNSDNTKKVFLYFNSNLSEFTKRANIDNFYILSKDKIESGGSLYEILKKEVPLHSYIGLDKTLFDLSLSNDIFSSFVFSDYYQSVDAQKGEFSVNLDMQGSLVFYTILNHSLDLDVTYERKSLSVGRDDFLIRVLDKDNSVIASDYVHNKNIPFYAEREEGSVHLEKKNLVEGLYKIEISGLDENVPLAPVSDDIVFKDLSVNSKYLVIDLYHSSIIRFVAPKTLFYVPMETNTLVTQSIPSEYLIKEDCIEKNRIEDSESEHSVGIRMEEQAINNKTIKSLSIPCSLEKIDPSYNLYSFTENSYFYPFTYYFTEINSIDKVIISGSDLAIQKKGRGYYSAMIDLGPMDYNFRKPVLFLFSIENNPLQYTGYHVKSFELSLSTE